MGVSERDLTRLAGSLESLARVLADRLQHPEPVALGLHLHERLVDERLELVEDALSGSAQTASTSANVHPPAKTAMRRNRRCSGSVSSEWLQSIVARSVCCRSGMSRAPDVSTSRAWSRRSSSASGDRSRSRAAASSSASGRPSSRGRSLRPLRRSPASARTSLGSTSRARRTSCDRRRDSSERRERDTRVRRRSSAASCSWSTIRSSGQRSISAATSGRGSDDLLEVVQKQERLPVADQRDDAVAERSPLRLLHVECVRERREELRRVGDVGERDERDTVQELGERAAGRAR